ncbi:MAG: cyclase family protein [Vicinamibacterales bacterium]
MHRRDFVTLGGLASLGSALALGCRPPANAPATSAATPPVPAGGDLWGAWDATFARARYISLSHVLSPDMPLWKGFPAGTRFARGRGRLDDRSPETTFTYEQTGFETTDYRFTADQLGTQLDPPAHWHPCFPAVDELPPTLALRKLVVISIAEQVQQDVNYHLTAADITMWEATHGRIPAGSVVMVRSDWYTRWPDGTRFQPEDGRFPGVSLEALKLLHLERHILFHGHEPLDTDSTPTLIGEDWLMNNGYMQAEGVANLDKVPPTGALLAVGFPRFQGGTGGMAAFTAICPPDWGDGLRPGDVPDAPLAYNAQRLVWSDRAGMRMRTAPCDKPNGKLSLNP